MAPIELLKQVPIFAPLSEEQIRMFAPSFHPRRLGRRELIFQRGDPGSSLYIVDQGEVEICLNQANGQPLTLITLTRGGVFGEMSLFDAGPRSATAIAGKGAVVFTIHRDDFIASVMRFPAMAVEVIRLLAERLREADLIMEDLLKRYVACGLARQLLRLGDQYGRRVPGGIVIERKLSQEKLASLLGCTREAVNRSLGQLRDAAAVDYAGPYLLIRDLDYLARLVSGDEQLLGPNRGAAPAPSPRPLPVQLPPALGGLVARQVA